MNEVLIVAWGIAAYEIGEWLNRRTPAHLRPRVDRALFWIAAVGQVGWIVWNHWASNQWGAPWPVPCVPPTCIPD